LVGLKFNPPTQRRRHGNETAEMAQKNGDVVRIEIEGIGTLENIVEEQ
jgi:2-keto-4-pentenoate hydratase/2-oxohepta-3-ene-1,7-dioic acid hydratase in catechol pathway